MTKVTIFQHMYQNTCNSSDYHK